jgi:hypothetical protein
MRKLIRRSAPFVLALALLVVALPAAAERSDEAGTAGWGLRDLVEWVVSALTGESGNTPPVGTHGAGEAPTGDEGDSDSRGTMDPDG